MKKFEDVDRRNKRLILGITSGRSGMRWCGDIILNHENTAGGVHRNIIAESFYRYIKWNKLEIDTYGIMEVIKASCLQDWKIADLSITITPYLSHDLYYVFKELKPDKIIWGINEPEFTVTSFYNKGWYLEEVIRQNDELSCGYQPCHAGKWNHFFGRIVPRGEFYHEWKRLTRIGKIAWYLNTINKEIYKNIVLIPKNKVWVFRLEEADQNYDYYKNMARAFGLDPILDKEEFLSIKSETVRASDNIKKEWGIEEREEYLKYSNDYRSIYNKISSVPVTEIGHL